MKILDFKKLILFVILSSQVMCLVSYAKQNPNARQEFEKPDGQKKVLQSDATIIDVSKYNEYNPLNPVPIGVNKEEYDSVDNYIIDLKTLDTRIKYFSPTYLNIKTNAEANLWMSLYLKGGSSISDNTFNSVLDESKSGINELKEYKRYEQNRLRTLKKEDPSSELIEIIKALIQQCDIAIKTAQVQYSAGASAIRKQEKMLKHKSTLNKIASIDSNNSVANARRMINKSIRNLVINYHKINATIEVLNEQIALNKSIYETYLRNYNTGVATSLEVSEKLNAYEDSKKTYNTTNTTFANLKEQICINLGYNIEDFDKLVFVEPEPDMDYIANINLDDDRDRAYNSNAAYSSIKISSKDMKLPGSTGEQIYNDHKEYVAEKVIIGLEDCYEKLKAALWTYNGAGYLEEITVINDEANERKRTNNLVSDVEYMGLKLQNLSSKLQIKNAKYDLLIAADDYYYATMGNLTIS